MGRPRMTEDQLFKSLEQRFHRSYRKSLSGCWLWKPKARKNGYGGLGTGKHGFVYAHRLSLDLHVGPPPHAESFACHTCDVRLCVNPNHLYWGDVNTNNDDAKRRGNLLKDQCRRGHPRTPENTYEVLDARGYVERHCRDCTRERNGTKNPMPGRMTDTHCRNGHELALVGVYESSGRRRCRECVRIQNRAR